MQKGLSFVTFVISAATTLSAAVLLQGDPVHACGGCFAPPNIVQTVTDHRMVLSVSAQQTTLWDQFSYTGNPENFSWILPVRSGPNVQLNLADDRFLTALDNLTAPQVIRPQPPAACQGGIFLAGAARNTIEESDRRAPPGAVQVFREEVVGPYAIAVIGGNDPAAIRMWLTDNGFAVPPSVVPVINYYVSIRSDFLALKLRAGASINRMNPVRVTMPGYAPTLPLRMVSAGVSDKVALNLIVLGTTRFQAANFPNAELRDSDLSWNWQAVPLQDPVTDFRAAQRRLYDQNAGNVWLTESAIRQSNATLQGVAQRARNFPSRNGQPATAVCPPPEMMQGMNCVEPTPEADMAVALVGLEGAGENIVVTRLRAELPSAFLDRDLQLTPSTNSDLRPTTYRYGVIVNPPRVPVCDNPGPSRLPVTPLQCSAIPGVRAQLPMSVAVLLGACSALFAARRSRASRR